MPVRLLSECTYTEFAAIDRTRMICILPVGATEAHGPHLPLGTDNIIAEAMAREGGRRLDAAGWHPVILPTITLTHAGFAANFAGTLSMDEDLVTATIVNVARGLCSAPPRALVVANAHLDPGNLRSIYAAKTRVEAETTLKFIFPDITRRPYGSWLSDEFRSGACHAGCYEGSMVMAERPDLVHEAKRVALADNDVSLSKAIKAGHTTFESAGGKDAYFGQPAMASQDEGVETIRTLGKIIEHSIENI